MKGVSSWQFGHQLPAMFTSSTLPLNSGSVFDLISPLMLGNENLNGSFGSFIVVCAIGSVGVPSDLALASDSRAAISGAPLFWLMLSVPSVFGVTSTSSGREPEKWPSTNLPSLNDPYS